MYEFRDQTAIPLVGMIDGKYPLSLNQGAAHAAEIPYVFNMLDMQNAERTGSADDDVAILGQLRAHR